MEEYRRFQAAKPSLREGAKGGRKIVGYTAVFDSWTTLGESSEYVQREKIARGAFAHALASKQDVRALFNHHADNVLGRTTSGTLQLREDATGLHVEIDPPNDEVSRRVLGLIERGDVTGMSFAFVPRQGGVDRTIRQEAGRTVVEDVVRSVDLYDVGPVTYPAYAATTAQVRGGLVRSADLGRIVREADALWKARSDRMFAELEKRSWDAKWREINREATR